MNDAFPPIYGGRPRALILGTFPSPVSRLRGEYYGNPNNQFWRIMYGLWGMTYDPPGPCYEEKKAALIRNGLALWDVLARCESDNALDSSIRNPVYNTELPRFIESLGIPLVLFNGGNAYAFYKRGIGPIEKNVLPSTSPANARYTLAEKARRWAEALTPGSGR